MKIRKSIWVLLLLFYTCNTTAQVTTSAIKPLTIGETRIIKSTVLQEDRTLNIYLPVGFDSAKAYPVIYLLDGSLNEDFLHIAGLVQFFNMQFKMPPCIVVGIGNTDRKRDFTFPTNIKDLKESYPTTGGSEKFIDFIEKEFQPYITAAFKVNSTRYIIGQSLGGLLATEILLKKPDLFTHYLIVSPSLWWDNESLLKKAPELLAQQKNTEAYIYLSVGTECKVMEKDAEELATKIKKSNLSKVKLDFAPLPDENHATILHNSIYKAFSLLFPYKE